MTNSDLRKILKGVISWMLAFADPQQSRTIQSGIQSDLAFLSISNVITDLYAFVCNDVESNYVSAFAECQLNTLFVPQSTVGNANK